MNTNQKQGLGRPCTHIASLNPHQSTVWNLRKSGNPFLIKKPEGRPTSNRPGNCSFTWSSPTFSISMDPLPPLCERLQRGAVISQTHVTEKRERRGVHPYAMLLSQHWLPPGVRQTHGYKILNIFPLIFSFRYVRRQTHRWAPGSQRRDKWEPCGGSEMNTYQLFYWFINYS